MVPPSPQAGAYTPSACWRTFYKSVIIDIRKGFILVSPYICILLIFKYNDFRPKNNKLATLIAPLQKEKINKEAIAQGIEFNID